MRGAGLPARQAWVGRSSTRTRQVTLPGELWPPPAPHPRVGAARPPGCLPDGPVPDSGARPCQAKPPLPIPDVVAGLHGAPLRERPRCNSQAPGGRLSWQHWDTAAPRTLCCPRVWFRNPPGARVWGGGLEPGRFGWISATGRSKLATACQTPVLSHLVYKMGRDAASQEGSKFKGENQAATCWDPWDPWHPRGAARASPRQTRRPSPTSALTLM